MSYEHMSGMGQAKPGTDLDYGIVGPQGFVGPPGGFVVSDPSGYRWTGSSTPLSPPVPADEEFAADEINLILNHFDALMARAQRNDPGALDELRQALQHHDVRETLEIRDTPPAIVSSSPQNMELWRRMIRTLDLAQEMTTGAPRSNGNGNGNGNGETPSWLVWGGLGLGALALVGGVVWLFKG
jgi:hypothetical protein